jgi:hypothetical protein
MSGYSLIKKLHYKGNVLLGAGCYAAALETRNPNIVAKVGTTLKDPWLQFYEQIIKKCQKNKYVPQIFDIHINKRMDYYMCKMERLDRYPSSTFRAMQHHALSHLLSSLVVEKISEQDYYTEIKKYKAVSDPDALLQILHRLQAIKPKGVRIDLHTGNLMYRNDELVVLDPWCEDTIADSQNVEDWAEYELGFGEYDDDEEGSYN